MNIKKLLVSSIIGAVAFGSTVAAPLSAYARVIGVSVTGHVEGNGFNPDTTMLGVLVTCIDQNTNTISATAQTANDENGNFRTSFASSCNVGDTVQAYVEINAPLDKGWKTLQQGSGVVDPNWDANGLVLTVEQDVPVSSVPEFGLIQGAMALFTSAGAFWALRKRKI